MTDVHRSSLPQIVLFVGLCVVAVVLALFASGVVRELKLLPDPNEIREEGDDK